MLFSITAIYAALVALLFVALAARVSQLRIRFARGIDEKAQQQIDVAVRAHGNLTEHAAITMVLMLLAESLGAGAFFLHIVGSAFFISRLAHTWGYTSAKGKSSVLRGAGAGINWLIIIVLSLYLLSTAAF